MAVGEWSESEYRNMFDVVAMVTVSLKEDRMSEWSLFARSQLGAKNLSKRPSRKQCLLLLFPTDLTQCEARN